ncbi:transcriptional enhancer factor TEF-3 [Pleurodeles waltl]|uniref:transcriptional enhancer factor TEF-3 n=1 Tax=Pleurodeles waltl TaxID=8319 RepID=UPI003709A966
MSRSCHADPHSWHSALLLPKLRGREDKHALLVLKPSARISAEPCCGTAAPPPGTPHADGAPSPDLSPPADESAGPLAEQVCGATIDSTGRNELIARYIKLRTGKTRTRKQVSSHIQVLARRKAREIQAKLKFWHGALSNQAGSSQDVKPFAQQTYAVQTSLPLHMPGFDAPAGLSSAQTSPPRQGRSIASCKLHMLEFSAFLEQQQDPDTYNKHLFVHIGQTNPTYADPYLEAVDIKQIYDKFPEKKGGLKELYDKGPANAFFLVKFWADLNTNIQEEGRSFYGVSSQYESPENMIITCSTKVCSFGKQVVEKVETEHARYENGRYLYRIHRSPLCEYMINFIHKLKHLPEKYMMNSVLENFTILQVVANRDTQETLLCIAYVFEVSASEHGAQHHIYRLVKD